LSYSREITGILLQTKNKFFPLPKLLQTKRDSLTRKISNVDLNLISIDKNKNYEDSFDFRNQLQNGEKITSENKFIIIKVKICIYFFIGQLYFLRF